ncbi:hypothetical protein LEN26_005052 [Aphanomyces euteiches]|nr:hypothetical protein LEN26_005052 [Aphanomyces euteiches]KAH9188397.1 hypothetical protein AeNC1_009621 [Aphanomyces euteiches]
MTLCTDELDSVWINEMIHQANVLGKRSNNGFKKEAWAAVLTNLNSIPGCEFNMMQLKSRNAAMRENFSVVWSMANASGMGFERTRSLVVCVSTTWEAFLQGKSDEIKKWRNKPFPLFTLCETLYSGTLAKGKHVLASNVPIFHIPCHLLDSDVKSSHAPLDDDIASDDGEDEPPQEINDDNESETAQERVPQQTHRRVSLDESPPKRKRQSVATVLAAELRAQNDTMSQELALFSKAIMNSSKTDTDSVVEDAIELLQTEFEYILVEAEMLSAIEVLANVWKAKIFLKLRGNLREAWLRNQCRIMSSCDEV